MKKLSTIIMALALVLGMSQCKKQETPATGNITPTNPGVRITVNVGDQDGKDNNGEKHNIAPQYGLFSFSDNDTLYVGHNGQYVGYLKYTNGFFDGTIYPDGNVDDQPLHFYFLGGKGPKNPTLYETEFSIDIANQSENLPVLSYGASNELYTGPNKTYSTTLRNKCALVRFDLQNQGNYEVTLSNVPTLATVNFANPTDETAIVATEGQTNANMTLYGEEGNTAIRWAILLPGTNLSTGHSDLNITYSGDVNLAELAYNDYVNSGISINNPLPVPDPPAAEYAVKTSGGTLTQFSVSANKKVYFSRGNLTWNSTAGYHFHDTQFDEEHSGGSSVLNFDQSTLPAYGDQQQTNLTGLDRFTWGHIPNQSINSSYYLTNNQMAMQGLDPEWGKQMTGDGNDHWRTLTADEWNYLLHERSGNRFMLVSVVIPITYKGDTYPSNIQGLLLFPDNFDYSSLGLTQAANANKIGFWPARINKVYAASSSYTPASGNYTVTYDSYLDAYSYNIAAGIYKLIEPANDLEHLYTNPNSNMYKLLEAGCVFLPAVGCREGAVYKKYLYYDNRNNAAQGFYWTSDPVTVGTQEKANYFWFGYVGGSNVETNPRPTFDADNTQHRDLGCCVRLVWDAN